MTLRGVLALLALPSVLTAQAAAPDPLARLRARPSPAPLDTQTIVFDHVRVLPMDSERALDNQTVVVRGGRIVAMGVARTVAVPPRARRIDGAQLTLLPALADMHIHLGYLDKGSNNPRLLELLLAYGVTTAMNLLGLPEHLTLRASVDSGVLAGPVLYTSGFWVNEPYVRTATAVDSAIRSQRNAGFDVIKVHGELAPDAIDALFVAARREGIPVVGHLFRQQGLRASLDHKQYLIAHVEEYLYGWFGFRRTPSAIPPDSVGPLLGEAARLTSAAGTWVSPTLAVFDHIPLQVTSHDSVMNSPEIRSLPASVRAEWRTSANPYLNQQRYPPLSVGGLRAQGQLLRMQTKALSDAGARLVLGTDAGVPGTGYGFSVHEELAALVAAGLTPYQALRSATSDAAVFVAAEREFGTVAVGRRADVLLVRGDPLKDVSVLRDPVGLMVRGRWYDRDALSRMRASADSVP